MQKPLLILLLCSIALIVSSCARIVLHPVTDQDIKIGGWCQPGWVCMSEGYIKEVMKAKVGG